MEIRPIFETSQMLFADPLMFKHLQELQAGIDYHSEEDYQQGEAAMFNLIVDDYNSLHDDEDAGYEFAWEEFKQFLRRQEEVVNMKTKDKFSAGQKAILDKVLDCANECTFYYDPEKDPAFDGNFDRDDVIGEQAVYKDLATLIKKHEELAKNARNNRPDEDQVRNQQGA